MKARVWSLALVVLSAFLSASIFPGPVRPPDEGTLFLPIVIQHENSAAGHVEILPNHNAFASSAERLHIVGEVQNHLPGNVRFIKIKAHIKDQNGQLLTSKESYAYLDILPSGEKTCFAVKLDMPEGWATYSFEPLTYTEGGVPPSDLAVLDEKAAVDPVLRWFVIAGEIRNDGAGRLKYVSAIATLYDANGKVTGCDFDFVQGFHLIAGESEAFQINAFGRDYSGTASYRLQIDGSSE